MTRRISPFFFAILLLLPACDGTGAWVASDPAAGEPGPERTPKTPALTPPLRPGRPDTEAWGRAVNAHGHEGGLDYAALARDRGDLDLFLDSVQRVDSTAFSENETLAFLCNVYNAVVAEFVLEKYPGIESVKDESGFFDERTFPVGGEEMTLDQIEARARRIDPRVHFAVVCASTSCPDLLAEAFVGERIDRQLTEQTRRFLSDPSKGLRYDADGNQLWLSSIFKWYAGDFTGGSTVAAFFARGGVLEWVADQAPGDLGKTLTEARPSVRYLDYDWSLNDRPRR